MPKHILLLLDKSMVELADINVDDIIVKWCQILARKDFLQLKSKPLSEPLITIFRPVSIPHTCPDERNYTRMKRKLVRSFERQIKWFKFITITNIDVLRPTDAFNFDMAGNFSNHGLQELVIDEQNHQRS